MLSPINTGWTAGVAFEYSYKGQVFLGAVTPRMRILQPI